MALAHCEASPPYSAIVERRIVAIGGGATGEPLRDYILKLSGRRRPSLLWVNTGMAEDARGAIRIYDFFAGRADVSRLEFFPWPPQDLRDFVLGHDVVFVGGGNPANMLAVWRVHGFDAIAREAWDEGLVLAGSSGGMHGWFEACVTDSFGPQLEGMRDGLGFLPASACAHFDDEELRRPFYRQLVDHEGFPAGYAADWGVGLCFVGTELVEVVTARTDGARAYLVEPGRETPLETRVLT
jgi:dipeptidase E